MDADWERAARQGNVDTLKRLLANGADVNARDAHGQTALMLAARVGHVSAVALLVERGADLNHTAKFHLSALILAVVNNHPGIVQALVDAGADGAIRGRGAPGFAGKTALDLAVSAGRDAIAEILRGQTLSSHERSD